MRLSFDTLLRKGEGGREFNAREGRRQGRTLRLISDQLGLETLDNLHIHFHQHETWRNGDGCEAI